MFRTILVADDSPTIRRIVELAFSDSEFRVDCVGSGGEALARLESVRPDLVLAAVAMPEPAGYELCRAIKASERPVPVILLAGTFEPFDPEMAQDCGADAHLIKPFESAALRDKVQQLLVPTPEGERVVAVEVAETGPPTAVEEVLVDFEQPEEDELPEVGGSEYALPDELPVAAPEAPPAELVEAGEAPSPELVEAVARAVVQRLSADVLREVAWEVVPPLATRIIRERIRELEREEDD